MRKKMINKAQMLTAAIISLLLLPQITFAQIDDLPCGGDDPYGTECPIDSWTWILVVAGLIYGAYSLHKASKRDKENLTKAPQVKSTAV